MDDLKNYIYESIRRRPKYEQQKSPAASSIMSQLEVLSQWLRLNDSSTPYSEEMYSCTLMRLICASLEIDTSSHRASSVNSFECIDAKRSELIRWVLIEYQRPYLDRIKKQWDDLYQKDSELQQLSQTNPIAHAVALLSFLGSWINTWNPDSVQTTSNSFEDVLHTWNRIAKTEVSWVDAMLNTKTCLKRKRNACATKHIRHISVLYESKQRPDHHSDLKNVALFERLSSLLGSTFRNCKLNRFDESKYLLATLRTQSLHLLAAILGLRRPAERVIIIALLQDCSASSNDFVCQAGVLAYIHKIANDMDMNSVLSELKRSYHISNLLMTSPTASMIFKARLVVPFVINANLQSNATSETHDNTMSLMHQTRLIIRNTREPFSEHERLKFVKERPINLNESTKLSSTQQVAQERWFQCLHESWERMLFPHSYTSLSIHNIAISQSACVSESPSEAPSEPLSFTSEATTQSFASEHSSYEIDHNESHLMINAAIRWLWCDYSRRHPREALHSYAMLCPFT